MLACAVAGLLVTSVVVNAEERVCRVRATHVAGWGRHRRSGRDRLTYRGGNGGWGGRIRTSVWRSQSPLPYRLATPQADGKVGWAASRRNAYAAASPIRPLTTHQSGRAAAMPAAAAAAAAAWSNRPKQVGPLPDMRASRHPGARGERRQKIADHGQQRAGRRLEIVAAAPQPVQARLRRCRLLAPAEPLRSDGREHVGGRQRLAGIDQDEVEAGQAGQRLEQLAHAPHQGGPAAQADEDVAAQPQGDRGQVRRCRRQAPEPGEGAQGRRRVGRAAADARGDRQPLVEPHEDARADSHGRGQPALRRGARCCHRPASARPRTALGTSTRSSSAADTVTTSPRSANATTLSSSW